MTSTVKNTSRKESERSVQQKESKMDTDDTGHDNTVIEGVLFN